MKTAKISEAKNNLSRLLKYVKRGGRVRIYDRDTPVADLVPVELPPTKDDDERHLESLVRRGLASPPKDRSPFPPELLRPGGPPDPKGLLLKALLEERRTGR